MDLNIKCPDPHVVGHSCIILYYFTHLLIILQAYTAEFWQSDYYNHTQFSDSLLITS